MKGLDLGFASMKVGEKVTWNESAIVFMVCGVGQLSLHIHSQLSLPFVYAPQAILKCRSEYAYGDNGSPPKIPGGATVLFDVRSPSLFRLAIHSSSTGITATAIHGE